MEKVLRGWLALVGVAAIIGSVVGCARLAPDEESVEVDDPAVSDDEFSKGDGFTSRTIGPTGRWKGQTEFVSAAPYRYRGIVPMARTTEAAANDKSARVVEESDIYKLDGNRLYVLNQWRGLHIVDVSNPAAPSLLGRAKIYGNPSEMYVRNGYAYVLLNDWTALNAGGSDLNQGAQLRVYDVRTGRQPTEVGSFDIAGYVQGSRVVGNVLYIVSNFWKWNQTTSQSEEKVFVQSINIANPATPRAVEREEFSGSGWTLYVSPDYIFIASGEWTNNKTQTKIRLVDIKDPAGRITIGGTLLVDGSLWEEARMDFFAGHLRLVTQGWDNGGWAKLTVAKVNTTRTMTVKGTLDLGNIGTLTGARYDGEKGYLVHGQQIDPLDVIDLSDPARPRLVSRLEIPGFFDHLVVRGDRVLAVGRERVNNAWKIAVALYDVANAAAPRELSRVNLGDDWAWVHDDSGKMKEMSILDSLGLVVLPFATYSYDGDNQTGASANRLQLLGLSRDALTKLGSASSADFVDRSFTLGDKLGALSSRRLASYSIADRNNPALVGQLEISRFVTDVARTSLSVVELVGDAYEGLELRTKSLTNPDDTAPLGKVALKGDTAQLYTNGSFVYVVASSWRSGEQKTLVHVVSTLPASNPRLQGTLELSGVSTDSGWGWGPMVRCFGFRCPSWRRDAKPVQVDGSLLVFQGTDKDGKTALLVADLGDPRTPKLAATKTIDLGTVESLTAGSRKVYVSSYEPVGTDGLTVKYYLTAVSLNSATNPSIGRKVNVPGHLITAEDWNQAQIIVTKDMRYRKDKDSVRSLDSLKIRADGKAELLDLRVIALDAGEAFAANKRAYYMETKWSDQPNSNGDYTVSAKLRTLSFTNPWAIRLASTKYWSATRNLFDVKGGFAFLTNDKQELEAYSLANADRPSFAARARFQGWSQKVAVGGNTAYLSDGNYGLVELDLD